MKILIKALLFTSLIFSSCGSEDSDIPTQFVTANIDGNNWEANSFTATHINKIVSIESNVDGETAIIISVQNVDDAGTYALGNVSLGVYEEGSSSNSEAYTTGGALGSGTITFDVLTNSVAEGSFSFTGGNGHGESITISNGKFKVNLIF